MLELLNDKLIARIELLAQKANDSTLTPAEDEEYKEYVDGGEMLAILQDKERRHLKQHGR